MLVAAIIGTLSLSNSTILYTTRVPATMAEDGYLPAWLGKIHRTLRDADARDCCLDGGVLRAGQIRRRGSGGHLHLDAHRDHAVHSVRCLANAPKMPDAPRSFRIPGGALGHRVHIDFSG